MTLAGLGLFLLEAGMGTALLLLFFPPRSLGKGFFLLHGALATAFLAGAWLARPSGYPSRLGAAPAVLLLAYSGLAAAGLPRAARPVLALGSAAAVRAL